MTQEKTQETPERIAELKKGIRKLMCFGYLTGKTDQAKRLRQNIIESCNLQEWALSEDLVALAARKAKAAQESGQ